MSNNNNINNNNSNNSNNNNNISDTIVAGLKLGKKYFRIISSSLLLHKERKSNS